MTPATGIMTSEGARDVSRRTRNTGWRSAGNTAIATRHDSATRATDMRQPRSFGPPPGKTFRRRFATHAFDAEISSSGRFYSSLQSRNRCCQSVAVSVSYLPFAARILCKLVWRRLRRARSECFFLSAREVRRGSSKAHLNQALESSLYVCVRHRVLRPRAHDG